MIVQYNRYNQKLRFFEIHPWVTALHLALLCFLVLLRQQHVLVLN